MPTNVRDPRSVVTPDAFEIDGALLGLPLAPPWRRFWALILDLAVVGLLTAVLSSVKLLLWTVIGLVLLRVALQKTGAAVSQAAGLLLRVAVGCLGVAILGIVGLVFAVMQMSGDPDVRAEVGRAVAERLEQAGEAGNTEAVRSLVGSELDRADDPEEALALLEELADEVEDLPLSTELKRQILLSSVPSGASWAEQAESLVDRALEPRAAAAGADPPDVVEGADPPGVVEEAAEPEAVDALEPGAAVRELAAMMEPGSDPDPTRYEALRRRVAEVVAGDTLAALADDNERLRDDLEDEREASRALAEEAEQNRSGAAAFAELMGDVWEQLGSAIGLWSVYFTVLLTLWNGQTVGKRAMGVRVLRLDGTAIGWWPAFERAGGYVAGLATGLLGFAQVFWDPNRQCIHDKIVGTVVVDDRAQRVPGAWQEAWAASADSEPRTPSP